MTVDEGKKTIEELKAQGNSEEEIAGAFYLMFVEGKIDVEQFDALVNLLGYHLTDEFKAMSPEEQKTKGYEEKEPSEEAQSQENQPKEEEKEESEEDESENSEEEEDEDEEARAMKLFGQ